MSNLPQTAIAPEAPEPTQPPLSPDAIAADDPRRLVKAKLKKKKGRKKMRRLRRREIGPEQRAWWSWNEKFGSALDSLIKHHPDIQNLVKRAEKIADDAMKVIEKRRPKGAND